MNFRTLLGLVIRYKGKFAGVMELSVYRSRDTGYSTSYWVDTSLADNGIARQALHILADFCFSQLKVPRFYVLVDQNNIASERVVRHVRGEREGVSFGMNESFATRKGNGNLNIWKLTASTIVPFELLFDPLPERRWHLPPSVDLQIERTGIPGTIRIFSHIRAPICVHYFVTDPKHDYCFPLLRRNASFSLYANENKQVDPEMEQQIRLWIARNWRVIRDYGENGDLWSIAERDAKLAALRSMADFAASRPGRQSCRR